ncbi:DNRLRE domain-containing protein [Candidatus Cloacimonadota bacterium]
MKKCFVVLFMVVMIGLCCETIVLQPGSEGKDTYICDCSPNTNNPNGSPTHLYQGQYGTCFDRTLIEWDLSSIPVGEQINSAIMEMDFNSLYGYESGIMAYYMILDPWEETEVTFNTQPAYNDQIEITTNWPEPNSWHAVDITQFVQYWIDNPTANFGVYCNCINTTGTCVAGFNSSDHADSTVRPKLTIDYGPVGVQNNVVFPEVKLEQNYPNPFNPSTEIRFDLSKTGYVDLKIYNLKGQIIKSLLNEEFQPGTHQITWDGRNDKNAVVNSGIYFARLKFNNSILTRKMVLLK